MILARTIKGKGVSFAEGKDGWHGKAFKKGEELDRALAELEKQFVPGVNVDLPGLIRKPAAAATEAKPKAIAPPTYQLGDKVATREAYGTAITKLGEADPRVVALDADVKNSTFSDKFEKVFPDRFYQNFIAEQVMVGAAMGLAARGAIPFPSTFACFLARAADFIRMAAISQVGIKMAGSHAGVSIGEDGPSQMALEDLAMCRAQPNIAVLYPCDAVSAERLVALAAYHPGPAYIRTSRPQTPVIYSNDENFTDRWLESAAPEQRRRRHGRRRRCDRLRGAQGLRHAQGVGHRDPGDRPLLGVAGGQGRPRRRRRVRPAGISSPLKITTRRAGLATRSLKRWPTPASPYTAWPSVKFRAAGSRTNSLDRFGISARHITDAVRAVAAVAGEAVAPVRASGSRL